MGTRIYCGNLPLDIRERDLDDLFHKFGRITEINIKVPPRPPAFAFINFEDYRDAKDAIYGRDGYDFEGLKLRVEPAQDRRDRRDRFDDRRGGYDRGGRGRGGPATRKLDHRITITDLPHGTSWQDLKDYFRQAGDVSYANVNRDGEGVVEFVNKEDMKRAQRKFDRAPFNDKGEIRVHLPRDASGSRSRSRSRSRSAGGDRQRSRSASVHNNNNHEDGEEQGKKANGHGHDGSPPPTINGNGKASLEDEDGEDGNGKTSQSPERPADADLSSDSPNKVVAKAPFSSFDEKINPDYKDSIDEKMADEAGEMEAN